mmetsp:Transcript_5860/g.36339  ORF Transcript_5860/g.36339 Transcript_5860/m.36339 type:complete len:326 (+) Transcript_5860:1160-2137(+)
MTSDRCATASIQRSQERPFARHSHVGFYIVERVDALQCSFVVCPALDPDGSLCHGRDHIIQGKNGGGVFFQVHPLESSQSKQRCIHVSFLDFPQPGLHIPTKIDDLEGRILVQDLAGTSQGRRSNDGSIWQSSQIFCFEAHEHVSDVFSRQGGGQHRAIWQIGRYVLHAVHANIHAIVQQCVVQFACEESFPSNVGQRLVHHLVASGLDDADLQRQVWKTRRQQISRGVRLRQRQRRSTRADAQRGRRGRRWRCRCAASHPRARFHRRLRRHFRRHHRRHRRPLVIVLPFLSGPPSFPPFEQRGGRKGPASLLPFEENGSKRAGR